MHRNLYTYPMRGIYLLQSTVKGISAPVGMRCAEVYKNPPAPFDAGTNNFNDYETVVPPGIEPGTQGFSVLCSTN